MMRQATVLFLCLLLSPVIFASDEQIATVLQKTALLSEPFSDAAEVTTLKARQKIRVLQRKGGWYQVSSEQGSGWLRMSRIRFGDGKKSKADGKGLSQTVQFLSTGRSGAKGVTVATGIRGLEAADVSNAQPDHNAVAKLKQFQVNPAQATDFANEAELKTQPLGYFKDKK